MAFFRRKDAWRMIRRSDHLQRSAGYKVCAVGMKAFHEINAYIKPTTRLIQLMGQLATRGRLELDESDLSRLVEAREIQMECEMDDGYVILVLRDRPLGLGLLLKGRLLSQIPKKETRFFEKKAQGTRP